MDKPVIILGGGFTGTLLALKLKESQPNLDFKLFEESSSLGGTSNCVFRENDCPQLFHLLKPLISHTWSASQFKSKLLDKWMKAPIHLIRSETIHSCAVDKLSSHIKLNNNISLELALQEASFVIDARDTSYCKKSGFVYEMSLEVELEADHYLHSPVLFDGVNCEPAEYFSYLPISDKKLIIQHHVFSKNMSVKRDEQYHRIQHFLSQKGFTISRVLDEKSIERLLPVTKPYVHQENRVISLAAFSNPTTGCKLTAIAELIAKMAQTSFRYGELKSLIKKESQEFDVKTEFYFYLNQQILKKQCAVFEAIFDQPAIVIERFFQNKLSFVDRSRIIYGHSHRKLNEVAKLIMPLKFYPPIQTHKALMSKF